MGDNPNYSKNLARLAGRSVDRAAELERVERDAIANFGGPWEELAAALGMLRLGDHVGWRVLVLLHNKRTIRKYEEILDINVRDFFPDEGPSADRSAGYVLAKKLGNFWKAVSGDLKIEKRREIEG
jgi:hypothetical protein